MSYQVNYLLKVKFNADIVLGKLKKGNDLVIWK